MTTYLLLGAAILVVAVLYIQTRPAALRVERSSLISAAPPALHALVDDFHLWVPWSPWENRDPNMKRTYSGAAAGVGAQYAWTGDKNVGEGSMTILESRPGELIRIKLEFIKPFAATNETIFRFAPKGNETEVTWTMTGKNGFMSKAMGIFMDFDKMIGGDFEKGLASMKAIAERKQG